MYTKKLNPDGTVNIYKARYCAKGYTQVENVDYKEIFKLLEGVLKINEADIWH